ncbi:PEP-CTERM sorting domain-containing protein [Nostoc sp.]
MGVLTAIGISLAYKRKLKQKSI